MLWDFEIRTDKVMPVRRPDLYLYNTGNYLTTEQKLSRYSGNRQNKANYYNVAVSLDWKVKDKDEKILKYQDIGIEIRKLWKRKAKVMPIIVGILSATSINFDKHLMEIPGNHNSTVLMKSDLLGIYYVVRRVLDFYVMW